MATIQELQAQLTQLNEKRDAYQARYEGYLKLFDSMIGLEDHRQADEYRMHVHEACDMILDNIIATRRVMKQIISGIINP